MAGGKDLNSVMASPVSESAQEKQCDNARALFKSAEDYHRVQELMIDYLRGDLTCNPWMLGPVTKDTIPLLASLQQLHSMGFMTTEGQPGLYTTAERIIKGPNVGKYYSERQTAYLSGFFPKARAKALHRALTADGLFAYTVSSDFAVLPPDSHFALPFVVTESKVATSPQNLLRLPWEAITHAGNDLTRLYSGRVEYRKSEFDLSQEFGMASLNLRPNVAESMSQDLVVLHVAAPVWGPFDLVSRVIRALRKG